ncbi:unnamed protein product [Dracunculus medinensis]|uniref:TLDc domain-containing protein n=1 Tax=Dracunculus medinensis TaxID=318479 RepID=A0A0N4UG93_DRAME|nr:unnamed protein product [Dracunculus medinensis]
MQMNSIIHENSDNFIEVLLTPENIFKISASSCGIEIDEQDSFFNDLLAKLETISSSSAELLQWKDQNCPRLFDSIQAKFLNILNMDFEDQSPVCKTDILSPFQLWFLQRSLPLLYFNDTRNSQLFLPETKKKGWDVLYSSKYEGLSAARFQAKVFDYRGATVTVICLENNSIYVIAIDQEWRNCGTCFGSNDSVFFQLSPRFIRVAKPSSFYCNLKFRSLPMKISFDKYFILDNAFHGVSEIEVFGCSGEDALIKQKDLKRREACQIEKNKKVSLPSTWDENPDRILLELGGLYSTANRREVFSRSDQ